MKQFYSFLLLLAATVLTGAVQAQTINGDLNHNGDLDVDDITLLINGYLTGEKEYFNGEGDKDNEYVDLGLSVKWATMNVGANAPEEYGDYFAWGETKPKDDYELSTYKWCNDSYNELTKYCTDSDYGINDNKTVLDLVDDAAHVNWGGSWRMPTHDEWKELKEKCNWKWTTQNGVKGRRVTGPNGNSIFLPAAGYRWGDSLYDEGNGGSYWSSSLFPDYFSDAYDLYFDSDNAECDYSSDRRYGHSVRAVCP
ncbi:MAG: hypothetical protein IJ901_11700 [Bacteroidaceae bacterium]|nr:hypothetical protein [Bacteroidaceae bacterium]